MKISFFKSNVVGLWGWYHYSGCTYLGGFCKPHTFVSVHYQNNQQHKLNQIENKSNKNVTCMRVYYLFCLHEWNININNIVHNWIKHIIIEQTNKNSYSRENYWHKKYV